MERFEKKNNCSISVPVEEEGRNPNVHGKCSHRIGPQGDTAPAAGAELGLAVGAQVATAVGELGLVADAAGGGVVPVDGGARRHRRLPDHRLPVAGQLLLDSSVGQKNGVFILWGAYKMSISK